MERIDYFMDIAKSYAGLEPNQIILVGAKTDLVYERFVNPEYLDTLLENYNFAGLIETSARNSQNIDVLFELATGFAMFNKGLISNREFKFFKQELEPRIQESKIEPIHKISRKCWKCERPLYFYEFSNSNLRLSEERLKKLWENSYLEFFCCSCFKKLKNNL